MSANKRESWKTIQEEIPAEVKEGLSYCSPDICRAPLFLDGKIPNSLSGVYFLYGDEKLQYIGETGDVKKRFQDEGHPYRKGMNVWVVSITSKNWRKFVETLLIQQFRPPENKRIPKLLKDDEVPPDSGWPVLESAYLDIQDNMTFPIGGTGVCSLAPINLDGPVTGYIDTRQWGPHSLGPWKEEPERYQKSFAELVEEAERKKRGRAQLRSRQRVFSKLLEKHPEYMSFLHACWRMRKEPAAKRDTHVRLAFTSGNDEDRKIMMELARNDPLEVIPDYVKEFFCIDLIHPTLAEIKQRAERFSMNLERGRGLITMTYHDIPVMHFRVWPRKDKEMPKWAGK